MVYMGKNFTATCEIENPEEAFAYLKKHTRNHLTKDWRKNRLVVGSEYLLGVKTGDGIGFHKGNMVVGANTVGINVMLTEHCTKPFKEVRCLMNNVPLRSFDELKFGHTYVFVPIEAKRPWEEITGIFKYFGSNKIIMLQSEDLFGRISDEVFNEFHAYQLIKVDQ